MELKRHSRSPESDGSCSINRTFMELKHAQDRQPSVLDYRINRTFMELKPRLEAILRAAAGVSIEPLWN